MALIAAEKSGLNLDKSLRVIPNLKPVEEDLKKLVI